MFAERGKPWHDNFVDYRWRSTRADAGLTHKLHDLRHYFASGLIAAGRRRDRAAGDGSRNSDDDAEHLRAPLADGRGQDARRGFRHGGEGARH